MDDVASRLYKLAGSYIKLYGNNTGLEYEDVIQELVIYTYNKYITKYNPELGSLSTFSFQWFRSKMRHLYKQSKTLRRNGNTISLESEIGKDLTISDTIADNTNIEQNYIEQQKLEMIIPKLKPETYDYYINGMTNKEISEKYNITKQNVNSIIKRNINKIKGELNYEN